MNKPMLIALSIILLTACAGATASNTDGIQDHKKKTAKELKQYSKAYFASGCFWCVEAVFESVEGVQEAVSGYSGGQSDNPTYKAIGTGKTGHAEAVEVYYDAEVIDFKTLVKVFYGSHDPTTVNGQAPDFGTQYRSVIFYQNEEERLIAEDAKNILMQTGTYDAPIATEIVALEKFYPAEDYHQDYERLHPTDGYVRNVSVPRLKKFQAKFPELLKKGH